MHLGNGAITPECAALAFGAAGVGLGAAAIDLGREGMPRQKLVLAAGLGGLVLAAQSLNVPVLPGSSAHLVGGVLLAWMLGPSLGTSVMAAALTIQALLLGDGGLASLGANIVNMALLPAAAVWALRQMETERLHWGALAAGGSVVLAAALIPLETALFRPASELTGWSSFASSMILAHLAAGLAEGALTFMLLYILSRSPASDAGQARPIWKTSLVRGACCLALLTTLFVCRSQLPDGYEASAEQSGMSWLLK